MKEKLLILESLREKMSLIEQSESPENHQTAYREAEWKANQIIADLAAIAEAELYEEAA